MGFWNAIKKWWLAGAAQANKSGNAALDADPLAVMENENEDAAQRLQNLEPAMRSLQGQVQLATTEVHDQEKDIARLDGMINFALQKKTPEGEKEAGELDAKLQALEDQHKNSLTRLETLTSSYETTISQMREADATIAQNSKMAKDMGVELKASEASRVAVETVANLKSQALAHNSTVERAKDALRSRIASNNAAAKVAADLGHTTSAPSTEDKIAQQMQAAGAGSRLAERKARLGMVAPAATENATTH